MLLDRELYVDYFEMIRLAAGDKEAISTSDIPGADSQTLPDSRYPVLRDLQRKRGNLRHRHMHLSPIFRRNWPYRSVPPQQAQT